MFKKIVISVIFFLILSPITLAKNKDEMLLYKAISLSRAKIEKDFQNGKQYNNYIKNYFDKLRINKDIKKVKELDSRLVKFIEKYSNNTYDRKYNLALNIYYRNKLLKDYILKDTNDNSNKNIIIEGNNKNSNKDKKNNSISDIISKGEKLQKQTLNNSKNNIKKSLSYSYSIPNGWLEEKTEVEGETILKNKNDSIFITITSFENDFLKFKNNFKEELLKNKSIRNFYESNINIDFKDGYKFSYDLENYEKNIYLIEYNNMVLVINSNKENKSINNLNDIINSLKIKN